MNASWVVVSESASASASGDTERFVRKWSDSCVTGMHDIKSIRMFEDDVTSPGHALVIQGNAVGSLGWWRDVCNLKNVCLLSDVTVL